MDIEVAVVREARLQTGSRRVSIFGCVVTVEFADIKELDHAKELGQGDRQVLIYISTVIQPNYVHDTHDRCRRIARRVRHVVSDVIDADDVGIDRADRDDRARQVPITRIESCSAGIRVSRTYFDGDGIGAEYCDDWQSGIDDVDDAYGLCRRVARRVAHVVGDAIDTHDAGIDGADRHD